MFDLSPGMQGFLGGAAAIGVPLLFNLGKEVIFDIRKRKAERAYISVQLIFLLDKFVARCADVAWDNGFDPMMPEPHDEELEDQTQIPVFDMISVKEGANKRGNSSRLTQPFHFFMFEPIFSPVNALNQPI
ncbi:hypothetical protein [Enterobacter kobei]|uniref:hypothetical protein n=1 Tax=Enterobacter kobei TaxID=208224 RepID=UPI0011407A44|nr:hypothetical protein [Enterobacter kobei]